MHDAPQRQAEILGGIECALTEQKFLPDLIPTRHVVPFGQRPDQAFAHGAAGLAQELEVTWLARGNRERKVALIEFNTEGPGAIIPLPVEAIAASDQLTDLVPFNPR